MKAVTMNAEIQGARLVDVPETETGAARFSPERFRSAFYGKRFSSCGGLLTYGARMCALQMNY